MSAEHSAAAPASGGSAVGKAIGAAFLVLFLMNNGAPDSTKLAVIVGVGVYLALSRKKDGGH